MNRKNIFIIILCLLFIQSTLLFALEYKLSGSKDTKILEITLEDALFLSFKNNNSLKVERLQPEIVRTFERGEEAKFDSDISLKVSKERSMADPAGSPGVVNESVVGTAGINIPFSTGTNINAQISSSTIESNPESKGGGLSLSVSQPLLDGAGKEVNLIPLKIARLNTAVSMHELRSFAESLAAQVEFLYWDYLLADKKVILFESSIKLAQDQLNETEIRINIGQLPESELPAARAEVASRQDDLINARAAKDKLRISLLKIINPEQSDIWDIDVRIKDKPNVLQAETENLNNIDGNIENAMKMRPDINQARLQLEQGNLNVIRTKNGLLPDVSFLISLNRTGNSDTYFGALKEPDNKNTNIQASLIFNRPWEDTGAKRDYNHAIISKRQQEEAFKNLTQQAELDVRTSIIEAKKAKERIATSNAVRTLRETVLKFETEKFKVGKSTSYLVAQAQRDLLTSQISELTSEIDYIKALTDMYRLEGGLLSRHNITIDSDLSP